MERIGRESAGCDAGHRERHRAQDATERARDRRWQTDLQAVSADWDLSNEPFERVLVKPKRGGVSVQLVALVWVPERERHLAAARGRSAARRCRSKVAASGRSPRARGGGARRAGPDGERRQSRRIKASCARRSRCSRCCPSSKRAASTHFRIDRRRAGALRGLARRRAVSCGRGALDPRQGQDHRGRAGLRTAPAAPRARPRNAMVAAGETPGRIHNNCSGKHAGMLARCVQQQWVTNGYHRATHPMQQRVRSTLERWMRDRTRTRCRRRSMAAGCRPSRCARRRGRRLRAFRGGRRRGRWRRRRAIFDAMVKHPEFVAGTDRLDTDLMRVAGTRLFAKVGAEGFYCAGVPSMKLGVALKVEDGAKRAAEPALLAVLRRIGAISRAGSRPPGGLHPCPNPQYPPGNRRLRPHRSDL